MAARSRESDDIKQAIQESYDDIVNSVQHHNVVPQLVAREILSPQDAERIQAEKVNQDRMIR